MEEGVVAVVVLGSLNAAVYENIIEQIYFSVWDSISVLSLDPVFLARNSIQQKRLERDSCRKSEIRNNNSSQE